MNVQIPIAGLTLSNGQTYNGQLPVWATRPLMIRVLPDFISGSGYPVYIRVTNGGAIKKEITLPYQEIIYLDLSFAAPLLRRADRNVSEGDPMFPQQEVEIWSSNPANKITLPVFHCDETYWDTLGVDSALPQPPKPRIPNQTLDIYFPYRIHPLDAFQVEVEPVTGAPSNVIFPATYVLGNTIDITYIKKLTIKNVWGSGLDQVINYEDRLHSDVIYDESLQCALRARWNMRNGQWFWAAFKDYFWSNKFTPIRGCGGVTEQAELTINLEYGEEWYNVYQELLVSSNVVFDLNLPGINQYQNKRFRAEVMGDTGARWSNSTKTYRQQVRFRTTELTDNYMFPLSPDQPPTPSIVFSAQFNPWGNNPPVRFDAWNNIYSNAAWYVESEPSWYAVANGTELLTPGMFEQGAVLAVPGRTWEQAKTVSPNAIRLKTPFTELNEEVYSLISGVSGYRVVLVYLNADGTISTNSPLLPINGRVNTGTYQQTAFVISKVDNSAITPADITTLNARWGKRYYTFPAGTQYMYGYMLANTGEARTGTLSLRSMAGAVSYPITINQAKASISLSETVSRVPSSANPSSGVSAALTANTDWQCVEYPTWFVPHAVNGAAGSGIALYFTRLANTGASMRSANVTYRSKLNPSVQASFRIEQAGTTGNISAAPSTITAGYIHLPVSIAVTSFGDWSVSERAPWITSSRYDGPSGITNLTLTIADNVSSTDPRTGFITFYNQLTQQIAVVTVNQAGAPSSIGISPFRITAPKTTGTVRTVHYLSANNWVMGSAPSWVGIAPNSGAAGGGVITVSYDTANDTGAKRSGYLRIEDTTTHEIALCIIEQEG